MEGNIEIPKCSNCRIAMVRDETKENEKINSDVIFFKCPNCGEQKKVLKQPVMQDAFS